jgi:hypothetical protein
MCFNCFVLCILTVFFYVFNCVVLCLINPVQPQNALPLWCLSILCSHLGLGRLSGPFLPYFRTNTMYAILFFHLHTTCPAYLFILSHSFISLSEKYLVRSTNTGIASYRLRLGPKSLPHHLIPQKF